MLCLKGLMSSKESTPTNGTAKVDPIHLVNALAACVISARLHADYRKWAVRQLVCALGTLGRSVAIDTECLADTASDLPPCTVFKLEAHENRVTGCTFHQRKNLIATRYVTIVFNCIYCL